LNEVFGLLNVAISYKYSKFLQISIAYFIEMHLSKGMKKTCVI